MHVDNILFFDSECLICNSFIKFVYKYDKETKIWFSNFKSKAALEYNINIADNSMVFYCKGLKYNKSSAFIEILKQLNSPPIIIWLLKIIPQSLRDCIYTFIANNRYQINQINSDLSCSLEINSKILK